VAIENGDFWQDMVALQRPFILERAMVVERDAAHRRYVMWSFN